VSHESAIEAITAAHFPGARLRSSKPLRGGVSAEVHLLTIEHTEGAETRAVLRIHGPTHNGHCAALEFALLKRLTDLGLPAPTPLAIDESHRIIAHPFLLLEYLGGEARILDHAIEACIATAADMLATIHSLPTASLPPLPLRIDPLTELLAFLPISNQWDRLRAHLEQRRDSGFAGDPVLLHGDFWPGNWVWQGRRLSGVLDWEDAALGDPLSDVACACLELRYLYGIEGADLFAEAYSQHHALDPERFALWQLYVAAAGQHSMGQWGLGPDRESAMRAIALRSIEEAAKRIMD
jgi:aminoglycoside phosphotransferase (APT) family kinase protein